MFKQLTPEEEREYRQWARDHFDPHQDSSPVWHPVVVNEWYVLMATYWANREEALDE